MQAARHPSPRHARTRPRAPGLQPPPPPRPPACRALGPAPPLKAEAQEAGGPSARAACCLSPTKAARSAAMRLSPADSPSCSMSVSAPALASWAAARSSRACCAQGGGSCWREERRLGRVPPALHQARGGGRGRSAPQRRTPCTWHPCLQEAARARGGSRCRARPWHPGSKLHTGCRPPTYPGLPPHMRCTMHRPASPPPWHQHPCRLAPGHVQGAAGQPAGAQGGGRARRRSGQHQLGHHGAHGVRAGQRAGARAGRAAAGGRRHGRRTGRRAGRGGLGGLGGAGLGGAQVHDMDHVAPQVPCRQAGAPWGPGGPGAPHPRPGGHARTAAAAAARDLPPPPLPGMCAHLA